MMRIVQVTQSDIDMGKRHNACDCPVALALKRAFNTEVRVGCNDFFVGTPNPNLLAYGLPLAATRFITAFDNRRKVEPFEFEVGR